MARKSNAVKAAEAAAKAAEEAKAAESEPKAESIEERREEGSCEEGTGKERRS